MNEQLEQERITQVYRQWNGGAPLARYARPAWTSHLCACSMSAAALEASCAS